MSCLEFKLATRPSRLALIQAEEAIRAINRTLPRIRFTLVPCSTPGDRDKTTDLRESDADFFTRDLHKAVLSAQADCAVHSAKDLEENLPPGMDWFWLPGPADRRDVLVLRVNETVESLPDGAIVGVSSRRREEYCRRCFPRLQPCGIRGDIEDRLAQLDAGKYDMLLLAGAALQRLGLQHRISRWIPLEELSPPEGQGYLAVTFRAGDPRFLRIRSLFVKPVIFAGAGSGSAEACTLDAWNALVRCDVCFHDNLVSADLLERLPQNVERVEIGRRCGDPTVSQHEINALITKAARQGKRVVCLKGGDPGIFGRLAQEIEALDALQLPYRVIPGVTSLSAATTGTGMLLTRRGVSRGFTVMTPREQGGGCAAIRADARASLPLVFFMGVGVLPELVKQLLADGLPPNTPAAVVFDAGSVDEMVIRGSLADIEARVAPVLDGAESSRSGTQHRSAGFRPGLVLVGGFSSHSYHPEWGALMGRRVLLPCSEALQRRAADAVRDFGGIPIVLPLIRTIPNRNCIPVLKTLPEFEWIVITSPSAVRILMHLLQEAGLDARALPRMIVAGPGTASEFKRYGVVPDLMPHRDFGASGVLELAKRSLPAGAKLLRLRSDAAGPDLAQALTRAGFRVEDCTLYANEPLQPERIPDHDAVFFASSSAVTAFMSLRPPESLRTKLVVAMGYPTLATLQNYGVQNAWAARESTVDAAIQALAARMTLDALLDSQTVKNRTGIEEGSRSNPGQMSEAQS